MKMFTKHTLLVFLLSSGLIACSESNVSVEQEKTAVKVDVFSIKKELINEYYSTSGIITSDHRVEVSSRLSGYIRNIKVREGSKVKKGDILFRVDPVDTKQQLAQAKADLNNAKIDLTRYRSLLADKAVTQQQFDQIKLRYDVAASKVTQAQNQLGYAVVRAPVDGIIVEKRLNVGDLASPGLPILTLEDPLHLLVKTYVSEKHIASINDNDKVKLNISSIEQPLMGEVRQVVQIADINSHKFLVKASVPAHKDIRPGIFVEVYFTVGQQESLLLPTSALIRRNGLEGVYIVDDNNIAHYRLLRLGQQLGDRIEVAAGLKPLQRVINNPPPSISTGTLVVANGNADE